MESHSPNSQGDGLKPSMDAVEGDATLNATSDAAMCTEWVILLNVLFKATTNPTNSMLCRTGLEVTRCWAVMARAKDQTTRHSLRWECAMSGLYFVLHFNLLGPKWKSIRLFEGIQWAPPTPLWPGKTTSWNHGTSFGRGTGTTTLNAQKPQSYTAYHKSCIMICLY